MLISLQQNKEFSYSLLRHCWTYSGCFRPSKHHAVFLRS